MKGIRKKEVKLKFRHFPIDISLDVFLPALLFSVAGKSQVFLLGLLFSFLHELAHLAAAKLLRYCPERITVNMFGEVLHLGEGRILPEHEILIHISGPMLNLCTGFLLFVLYRNGVIPEWRNGMLLNGVLGLFNLLPFYPLDGGKIVFVYLKYFMEEETARRLLFLFAKVFLIFNFFFGIYLIQYNLLNCLVSFLAANLFFAVRREEASVWYKGIMKAKQEQEHGNYV